MGYFGHHNFFTSDLNQETQILLTLSQIQQGSQMLLALYLIGDESERLKYFHKAFGNEDLTHDLRA